MKVLGANNKNPPLGSHLWSEGRNFTLLSFDRRIFGFENQRTKAQGFKSVLIFNKKRKKKLKHNNSAKEIEKAQQTIIKKEKPAKPNQQLKPKTTEEPKNISLVQKQNKPNINYTFNSVRKHLYETNYLNSAAKIQTAALHEETYNPVMNKQNIDDLIKKTRMNNEYKTDNYINPFLQEKFDAWRMLHKIDIQVKYAIETYSAPRNF